MKFVNKNLSKKVFQNCIALQLIFILTIIQLLKGDDTKINLPNLKIPNKNDTIVIIGGGPSGVDMAVRLKNLGYQNLRILEKNHEVGGKSQTRVLDGIAQDMGTTSLLPGDQFKNMIDLVEKYDKESLKSLDLGTRFLDTSVSCYEYYKGRGFPTCKTARMTLDELVVDSAIAQEPDFLIGLPYRFYTSEVVDEVVQSLKKYNEIHNQIFGNYHSRFLPRPTNLSIFEMSADQFLEENDLNLIRTLFKVWQTGYGYGYLDEIPAYYLMHLVNPLRTNYTINRVSYFKRLPIMTYKSILVNGFQPFWQKMIDVEQIQVETSFEVTKISRKQGEIQIFGEQNGKPQKIEADFVFVTVPQPLPLLENPTQKELNLLENITTSTFTATLLQGVGFFWNPVKLHSLNNANRAGEASQKIWWYWSREGQLARSFDSTIDNRTIVSIQYHYNRDNSNYSNFSDIALDTIVSGGLDDVSAGSPEVQEVFEQIVFDEFFPRYSNEQLKKGGHWNFLEIQGEHNTIYLGALPSGLDTTEDVISYNKMIADEIEEQLLKKK